MNVLEARRRLLGAGVYKKTVTGNPAIAQGSLARMYPGITMQGWTEQSSTTGAQIFNKNTVDKNKYISDLNGNAYEGSGDRETSASDYIQVSGLSYVFATETGYRQWMAFYDEDKKFITGLNGYGSLQVPQSAEYARFTILSSAIDTFMVNEGSTALPWEPYTGGAPSPSPDYPQEIVSAGEYDEANGKYKVDVALGGAQLLNLNDATLTGCTLVDDKNGAVKSNLNNQYYCEITIDYLNEYAIRNKGNYLTFSCVGNPDDRNISILIFGERTSGAYYQESSVQSDKITVKIADDFETVTSVVFRFNRQSSRFTDKTTEVTNLMVNYGSTALPYQPYRTPQTLTLTADRPLTKWDRLTKENGQWGWVYKSKEIESYTDESVPGEYFSTTGQLSTGAQVWYETTEETFIPLTTAEQEAMNALHTYRPTTVLSNQQDCDMTLTYKTRKGMS